MKKVIISIFVIALVGSMGYAGYYIYKKAEEAPIVYSTTEPVIKDIQKKSVATGSIKPRKEIDLKSQLSGVVEELYVEAGTIVQKGDKIAKIRIMPNVVNLNNAEANVKRAQISFNNAKRELERQEKLFEKQMISEFDMNQQKLTYELEEQNLEAAKINLQLVREGSAKESGNKANVVLATAEGMVLDVPVKEGSFVIESNTFNDGTTIATVADMTDLIFEGFVDESEVGKITEGMPLSLQVGAIQDQNFIARLEYISPKGTDKEGAIQFEIRAEINTEQLSGYFLRAGYSANADIILDERKNVLSIQERYLLFTDGKVFVEIETAPNTFEKREVEVGLSDGIQIEVVKGISETDKIKEQKEV